MKGILALEDGTVFEGTSFGAPGTSVGEVVFHTGMSGYQEILTDPSYKSQIMTMTYPLIGNYGVNRDDIESDRIQVEGFVVKEACRYPSNHTCTQSLGDYLKEQSIVGIEGIDTRKVTRHTRLAGAMKGCICAGETVNIDECIESARGWRGLVGVDTVKEVGCTEAFEWKQGPERTDINVKERHHVVAFDCGIKFNILRILRSLGCAITVVPANTSAKEVRSLKPDGVFISNGPGDPAPLTYTVETIRELIGTVPLFGICLGNQLLSLALGGKTYKLKFGHHGANHPVKNLRTEVIEITSQNHGFCVDQESLSRADVTMTHLNLNDHTCEGIANFDKKFFSVQYHPEASPGPHDSGYLFEQFIELMGN